jgi:23S rRNA (adenine2503-C2)-methyltransferase
MTGSLGLSRNLTGTEIIEQFLHISRRFGPVDNVVFMGMGEPLHNLKAVLPAVRVLSHPIGPAIPFSRITLSTSGAAIGGIRRLAQRRRFSDKIPGRPRLAVSLITGRPDARADLIPPVGAYLQTDGPGAGDPGKSNTQDSRIHRGYAALRRLRRALSFYQKQTGRSITFELVLIGGITDSINDADSVVDFIRGSLPEGASDEAKRATDAPTPLDCNVNIIRWNPVAGLDYTPPSPEAVARYAERLCSAGVAVTLRYPRGLSDQAGCGQLGATIAAPAVG